MSLVGRLRPGRLHTAVLAVLLGLLPAPLPAPGDAQPAPDREPDALVDFHRAYRLDTAASIIEDLAAWSDTLDLPPPPHVQDRILLLDPDADPSAQSLNELAVTAAVLHSLAGETAFGDPESASSLHGAAAALTQEILIRLVTELHPAGVSVDSLRALGNAARTPPPGGFANVAARTPAPFSSRDKAVLLERADRFEILPPGGGVDWFRWIPGRDEILLRAAGVLYRAVPTNLVGSLGPAGEAALPALSANGEYIAALAPDGDLHLLRMGVAARPWWLPVPGSRPSALAFSPVGLEVAFADSGRVIRIHDVETGLTRTVARTGDPVTALHWSPSGRALAWDAAAETGVRYFAGAVDAGSGRPVPFAPDGASLLPSGPPQWAPDSRSILALGRVSERSGLWRLGPERLVELLAAHPADPSELLVSPDFHKAALTLAPEVHPRPWGDGMATPFAYDARPLAVASLTWPEGDAALVLDLPLHRTPGLCWSSSSALVVRRVDQRAETLRTSPAPLASGGLWAVDLRSGEEVPLTFAPGDYRDPRFSSRESWLAYLEVVAEEKDGRPRGRLWIREMIRSKPSETLSERAHLRALPAARRGDPWSLVLLRDALRLDPDRESARHALGRTSLDLAAGAASAAETGLLLGAAVRELVLVHAQDPGNPIYVQDLVQAFLAYAAVAGRYYSAEAAERARTFLEADPGAEADPEVVRTALHPALVDAVLWDPRNREAWRLLESGLTHYR